MQKARVIGHLVLSTAMPAITFCLHSYSTSMYLFSPEHGSPLKFTAGTEQFVLPEHTAAACAVASIWHVHFPCAALQLAALQLP